MEILDLRLLGIQKIQPRAFNHFTTSLKDVNLKQNLLVDFPWDAVRDLQFLERLRLGSNRITSLGNETFRGLDNLLYLGLAGNQITQIDIGDLCTSGVQLKYLILNYNPLSSVININKCQYIGQLSLNHCAIKTLPLLADPSGTVITIDHLLLGNNGIHSIDTKAFSNVNITTSLSLTRNELAITSVNSEVWKPLSYLKILLFDTTIIKMIPNGYFKYLHNLQKLFLKRCKISELEQGSFSGLSQLQVLDLSQNNLSVLPEGAFAGLTKLTTLELGRNQISFIAKGTLLDLHSLNFLELFQNSIHALNFMLPGLNEFVSLQNNPIACSCSLLGVLNFTISLSSTCFYQNCSKSMIRRLSPDICSITPINRSASEQCHEMDNSMNTNFELSVPKSHSSNQRTLVANLNFLCIIAVQLIKSIAVHTI